MRRLPCLLGKLLWLVRQLSHPELSFRLVVMFNTKFLFWIVLFWLFVGLGQAGAKSVSLTKETAIEKARAVAENALGRDYQKHLGQKKSSKVTSPKWLEGKSPNEANQTENGWEITWEDHPPIGLDYSMQILVELDGEITILKSKTTYTK